MINTIEDLMKVQGVRKTKNINWVNAARAQFLSEDFMNKYFDKLDKVYLPACQKLSEPFMDKHFDDLEQNWILEDQKLGEAFMDRHFDELIKFVVSSCQSLSEKFMEKHFKELHKGGLSKRQKLSETFMEKHFDKLNKDYLSKYQKLSEPFVEKHSIVVDDDNWLYKSTAFKKQQVIDINLYECFDDYFIAYKGIRSDNYSNLNFQYQYFTGKSYSTHADYTDNENSFGFFAWTEVETRIYCNQMLYNYCNQKIIKVKIFYKDIARVVQSCGNIRCCKVTVLEEI